MADQIDSPSGAPSTLPTRPAGAGRLAGPPLSSVPAGDPAAAPVSFQSTLPTRRAGTAYLPAGTPPAATVASPFLPATAIPLARQRNVAGLALAAVLILTALVFAALVFANPFAPQVPMGEVLQFPDQGHTHIAVAQPHPTYASDPATSGWHREEFPPINRQLGYMEKPLDDEVTVHLMEHGHIIAWYSCAPGDDCTALRDKLAQVARAVPLDSRYILYVVPRASLPGGAHVALGAWQHLEYLKDFDAAKIDDFLKHFGAGVQETMPTVTR